MSSSYRSIKAERRNGDNDHVIAEYNIYKDDDKKEQKEYFSKTKKSRSKKTMDRMSGKSLNKQKWATKSIHRKGDEKTQEEGDAPYDKHSIETTFDDFKSFDAKSAIGGAQRKRRPASAASSRRKSRSRSRSKSRGRKKKGGSTTGGARRRSKSRGKKSTRSKKGKSRSKSRPKSKPKPRSKSKPRRRPSTAPKSRSRRKSKK